jgi:hypothetical protein
MTEEIIAKAFIENPLGVLFGFGFLVLCFYIGLTLIFYGWPDFRRRK